MSEPTRKRPTLADIDALPPGIKGEIIEGVLYTMSRPRARHQELCGAMHAGLRSPFGGSLNGPGGWWILPEPGIELPGSPEFTPDIGGWRRERMPTLPKDDAISIVPDWLCEILSPATRRHVQLVKKPFYARIGLPHFWLVDLEARVIVALRLEAGRWVEVGTFAEEPEARIEPFDAVAFDLRNWWVGVE